jgi:hypothetical protein
MNEELFREENTELLRGIKSNLQTIKEILTFWTIIIVSGTILTIVNVCLNAKIIN